MADITKCNPTNCPVKDSCYRFTAKSDRNQSWFVEQPGTFEDGIFRCDMYWGKTQSSILETLESIVKEKE